MNVFTVLEFNYEDTTIHGVFGSKQKANEYVKQVVEASPIIERFGIKSHELDKGNFLIQEWIVCN